MPPTGRRRRSCAFWVSGFVGVSVFEVKDLGLPRGLVLNRFPVLGLGFFFVQPLLELLLVVACLRCASRDTVRQSDIHSFHQGDSTSKRWLSSQGGPVLPSSSVLRSVSVGFSSCEDVRIFHCSIPGSSCTSSKRANRCSDSLPAGCLFE